MEAESFAAEEGTEAGNEGVGTADMEDTIMVTVTATATATATVMKVNITTSVDAVRPLAHPVLLTALSPPCRPPTSLAQTRIKCVAHSPCSARTSARELKF